MHSLTLPFRARQRANPNDYSESFWEKLRETFFRTGHSIIQRAGDIRVFLHENQYGTTADSRCRSRRHRDPAYRAGHVSTSSFLLGGGGEGNWDRIGTSVVRTQFVKHRRWVGTGLAGVNVTQPEVWREHPLSFSAPLKVSSRAGKRSSRWSTKILYCRGI